MTDAEPLVVSQAAGACTAFNDHCWLNSVSLGVAWRWRTRSGLTSALMPARARVAPARAGSPVKRTTPLSLPLAVTLGWPSASRTAAADCGLSTTEYDCGCPVSTPTVHGPV